MASSQQHRCVFVGNIPYDATEEQLVQICEEVGPVVSFRLVIDRETGKPKGYGFCEYKDEETALSARRNLQGYEINGRQLRVDFAENDKGADRNREQGRGGPGMATNVEPQKKHPPSMVSPGDLSAQQPVGLPLAMAAASAMAGALGGAQSASQLSRTGLQNQSVLSYDPLTLHLAKMPRCQLSQVMSEMKLVATQNKELARQLLLLSPQLAKGLFQAQIMLGMVTPEMFQMPNIRQVPGSIAQSSQQGGLLAQPPAVSSLPGLPPVVPSVPQNSSLHKHHVSSLQLPAQPSAHLPHQVPLGAEQKTSLGAVLPSAQPQPLDRMRAGPQMQLPTSLRPTQVSLSQHAGQTGVGLSGGNSQPLNTNANLSSSLLNRPAYSNPGSQSVASLRSGVLDKRKDISLPAQAVGDRPWPGRVGTNANLPSGSSDKIDASELGVRPSKFVKSNNRSAVPSSTSKLAATAKAELGPSNASDNPSVSNRSSDAGEMQNLNKQAPQMQLPEVESALLQQVMNLTPEQLSSLPPEQQQQVIQLQQMLR